LYNNRIVDNNTPNFAPKSLGPIYFLPTGTGVYVMAIKDVEAFGNTIQGNNTVNLYVINYKTGVAEGVEETAAQSEITRQIFAPEDKRYYPFPEQIYFHDNDMSGGGKSPDVRIGGVKMLADALGGKLPDILYDGLLDKEWKRKGPNTGQICLQNNGPATFLNFDAGGGMKHPVNDLKQYACSLPALSAVSIPQEPASTAKAAAP